PMDSPFLEAMAAELARAGVRVVRFEFPYMAARRERGRRPPPDREPVLRERWLQAIARLGGGGRVALGGQSLGGRTPSRGADAAEAEALSQAALAPFRFLPAAGDPAGRRRARRGGASS